MKSRLAPRFAIAASLALFATAATAASDIVMHRDPGCGCCEKWAMQVKAAFGRKVRVIDDANRAGFKAAAGVPANLVGCHTAVIDGYSFEAHVPIADMKRLIAAHPKGVRGLAVTGMPGGSAGMEMAGMAPLVLHELKRAVVEDILPRGPSEQMALHGARMAGIRNSADVKEGVRAFQEKRAPRFEGI